jgi:hypothetical protein
MLVAVILAMTAPSLPAQLCTVLHCFTNRMKTGIGISQFSTLDTPAACRHIVSTSLLSVSTAGRGAASSEAALAFFTGRMDQEVAA